MNSNYPFPIRLKLRQLILDCFFIFFYLFFYIRGATNSLFFCIRGTYLLFFYIIVGFLYWKWRRFVVKYLKSLFRWAEICRFWLDLIEFCRLFSDFSRILADFLINFSTSEFFKTSRLWAGVDWILLRLSSFLPEFAVL